VSYPRAVHVVATLNNGTDEVKARVTYRYENGKCITRVLTGKEAIEWLNNNEPYYRNDPHLMGCGKYQYTTMPGGYIWRWEET
jgi:hypothetical protein